MLPRTPFTPDHDRFYYEPRVYWSTVTSPGASSGALLKLPQEHFRNISRFPVRLTKLLVSPVGYLFRQFTPAPATPAQYQAFAGVLGRADLSIEYPRGFSGQKRHHNLRLFGFEPTADPSLDEVVGQEFASSLFGVSRWDFDLPYFAPQDYAVALELSNLRQYVGFAQPVAYLTARAFYERTRSWILGHNQLRIGASRSAPLGFVYPEGPQPVGIPDQAAFPGAVGNAPQGWDPVGGGWPASDWQRSKANRGLPYTEVTGFSVWLDQRGFDDSANAFALGLGLTNVELAPLAQRIATKCKTVGGGTGERWWRDGAPLSLVTPSINSAAFVKTLEDPIILGPGEAINVSIRLPAPITFPNQETLDPTFSLGVSFAGYACVEDNARKIPPIPGTFVPQPMM